MNTLFVSIRGEVSFSRLAMASLAVGVGLLGDPVPISTAGVANSNMSPL